jgi:hypothetical protein
LAWQADGETKELMKKVVIFWIVLPATAYPCIFPCMEAGLFPDVVFIVLDEVNYHIVCTIMVSAALVIFVSRHDLKKKKECHS